MSFTKKETQNENKSLAKPQSSFLESLARMLPLLTLTFEQFTGQPIPQMSGTIADIAASLLQIQQTQQTILQKITDLEKNCAEQFIHQEQQLTSLQQVNKKGAAYWRFRDYKKSDKGPVENPVSVPQNTTETAVKKTKNPAAYYQCLLNAIQQGSAGRPITELCRNCKINSVGLAQSRNQQISNLLNAYRQIGEALSALQESLRDYVKMPLETKARELQEQLTKKFEEMGADNRA
ncbi:486_t:CDS:2 [Cetraspora pellucida]|uniref:486_t:CDS:1 n=1 Tax=Cetraspora pellucida TaxID=1433469 RepID=A0ACA9MYG7_9GLOM|nr:486_t:CDS:2 [Cetraspora pellucida]